MGFAIYRQSKDWSAKDFDTGGDRPFASLANVPRQILEGLQLKKENELKERQMKGEEQKIANDTRQTESTIERNKAGMERDAQMGDYYQRDIALEERKVDDELKRLNSPEAKEMLKLSMDREKEIINKLRAETSRIQRDSKTEPDKTKEIQSFKKELAYADVVNAIRGTAGTLFDEPTYQKWAQATMGMKPQELPGTFLAFINTVPPSSLDKTSLEYINDKIIAHNTQDYLLNVAMNDGKPQREGLGPLGSVTWMLKKMIIEKSIEKETTKSTQKTKPQSISDKIMPKKDNKIQGLFGNFFRGDIE